MPFYANFQNFMIFYDFMPAGTPAQVDPPRWEFALLPSTRPCKCKPVDARLFAHLCICAQSHMNIEGGIVQTH